MVAGERREFTIVVTDEEAATGRDNPIRFRNRRERAIDVALTGMIPDIEKDAEDNYTRLYSCSIPPIFIISVSLIELIVHIVYVIELKDTEDRISKKIGWPYYSPLAYIPSKRHEAWRFITYMLIHQDWQHVIGNIVSQLLIGLPLELAHKGLRVMTVYMAGVLMGSLLHSMIDHNVNLIGASGGMYSLFGAHIASVAMNWDSMNYKLRQGNFIRTIVSAPVRLGVVLVICCGLFAMQVHDRYFATGEINRKIGIMAHLGGIIAGAFLGMSVVKNLTVKFWEPVAGKVFLVIFILILLAAIFFNIFYEGYPPNQ